MSEAKAVTHDNIPPGADQKGTINDITVYTKVNIEH